MDFVKALELSDRDKAMLLYMTTLKRDVIECFNRPSLSPMAAEYLAATTVPTIHIDEICRIDERDWDKLIPTVNKEWIRRIEK